MQTFGKKMIKYLHYAVVLLALLILVGCQTDKQSLQSINGPSDSYLRGVEEAKADIQRGKYIIKTFGYPPPYYPDYRHILSEYNIELKRVAGCIVISDILDYVRGYNEVSRDAIEKRYGKGFLDGLRHRAKEEHKMKLHERKS